MTGVPLTIREAAAALRAGSITASGLARIAIERANRLDPSLGVYITRTDETALAAAGRADADFRAGIDRGPLQGITIGVKDILSTSDAPTTAQSMAMDASWGDQGDGPVVARLRSAGAAITGKNTTMEFANGQPDAAKPFPVPRNPWDTSRWTGGSSSGTAGGVAAGLFLGGIGTDTGGSIRWPAAYCGISGLKATFGRVPKSGCTQNGFSLDHVGPLARSAWDCAAILEVIAGHDPSDVNACREPVPPYTSALTGDISGLRVGVVRRNHTDDPDCSPDVVEAFEAAVSAFEDLGAVVDDVVIPHYEVFANANWVNNTSEKGGIYLTRHRERWSDWGRYTRVGVGSWSHLLTAADFIQALRVRRYAIKVIGGMLASYDVLFTPTAKGGATPIDSIGYGRRLGGPTFTGVFSMTGFPVLAVPMGFTKDRLPLSLQIVGRPFDEATVLRAGDAYQQRTSWHLALPPVLEAMEVK